MAKAKKAAKGARNNVARVTGAVVPEADTRGVADEWIAPGWAEGDDTLSGADARRVEAEQDTDRHWAEQVIAGR